MKYYAPTKLSENIHATPEGYLLCIGVSIGRVGEMVYGKGETPLEVGEDNRVIVSRDEDELFRPETIASFEGKSFTITHPEEFVDPSNWQELTTGILQNVRRGKAEDDQADDLVADVLITHADAIKKVNDGMREVSCGYEAEYIQTEKGRGKQINIIGNHLALVEQGRAGSSYAITDQKENGKGAVKMAKTALDKLKALWGKTQDEAAKIIDEAAAEEKPKKDDAKDEDAGEASMSLDALGKMVKDLADKFAAYSGEKGEKKDDAKDADKEEPKKEDDKEAAKDDAPPASMEDRMKALEGKVAELLSMLSEEDESEDAEEGEESDKDESEDDEAEESEVLTGDTADTASRVEILAPGLKLTKDVKAQALKTAYATVDGKAVIDSLTAGKGVSAIKAEHISPLFVAASEVLKAKRSDQFAQTKKVRTNDFQSTLSNQGHMTPEKLNELNAARYAKV